VDGFNDSGQDAKYRQDKGKQAHESTSDAWAIDKARPMAPKIMATIARTKPQKASA
jgi:hypothetical protein